MAEIRDLNVVDDANTARFPEGQAPSSVNDGARAGEGLYARAYRDTIDSGILSTGADNAYAVTSNRAVPDDPGITGLYHGLQITFQANHANTGAATLALTMNTTVQPAKALVLSDGTSLVGGEIGQGAWVTAIYNSGPDHFKMISMPPSKLVTDPDPTLGNNLKLAGFNISSTAGIVITPASGQNVDLATTGGGSTFINGVRQPLTGGTVGQIQTITSPGVAEYQDAATPPSPAFTEFGKSAEQTLSNGATITVANSSLTQPLTGEAEIVTVDFVCKVADVGFSVGESLAVGQLAQDGEPSPNFMAGLQPFKTPTSVGVQISRDGIYISRRPDGVHAPISLGNWRAVLKAWR